MSLYRCVRESADIDQDLPILERLRLLTEFYPGGFDAALPTHGLRERVRKAITEAGRQPIAENLLADPTIITSLYDYPLVIQAQLSQGNGRVTGLMMRQRQQYTIPRRNVTGKHPIVFKGFEDFKHWRDRGSVEFLAETGYRTDDGFLSDYLFVDLDPKEGYPFEKLRQLTTEVVRRFQNHEWVERVEVNWTGGKGFHIHGFFKGKTRRPVDQVNRALQDFLMPLCNDVSVFMALQANLFDPYVVLDLSPMKTKGIRRNAFSLHGKAGGVCIPIELDRLGEFDPVREASPAAVMAVMERMARDYSLQHLDYEEMLPIWFKTVREVYPAERFRRIQSKEQAREWASERQASFPPML